MGQLRSQSRTVISTSYFLFPSFFLFTFYFSGHHSTNSSSVCMYLCICVYIYTRVCIYIHICVYVYMYQLKRKLIVNTFHSFSFSLRVTSYPYFFHSYDFKNFSSSSKLYRFSSTMRKLQVIFIDLYNLESRIKIHRPRSLPLFFENFRKRNPND